MNVERGLNRCTLPLEVIDCPACGGKVHSPVAIRADELSIVRCECGLAFVNPRPEASSIPLMYDASYYSGGKGSSLGYESYIPTLDDFRIAPPWGWELIASRVSLAGSRGLDVGCAYGKTVYWMRKAGAIATGIDLIPAGIEWGRRLGLDLRVGTIETLDGNDQFDVITLMDIIEHIPDLSGFMDKLRGVAKPGAYVFAQTPNFGNYRGSQSVHLHRSLEHLTYFTISDLDRLFRKNGFQPATPTTTYCVVPTEIGESIPPPSRLRQLAKRIPFLVSALRLKQRYFPMRHQYIEDPTGKIGSSLVGIYRVGMPE